ncbi:MAG: hypothetical protein ACI86S_002287 [Paracoccaceae bacterium]|jgi:hypothetical protein
MNMPAARGVLTDLLRAIALFALVLFVAMPENASAAASEMPDVAAFGHSDHDEGSNADAHDHGRLATSLKHCDDGSDCSVAVAFFTQLANTIALMNARRLSQHISAKEDSFHWSFDAPPPRHRS